MNPFVAAIALKGLFLVQVAAPVSRLPLFDALPFATWRVVGGAAAFELMAPNDGSAHPTLVGKGPIERNGFLASPRELSDFRLSVELRLASPDFPKGEGMNSGIQIRSAERSGTIAGLQVEIDPTDRRWSGGVYDERGRGWLVPLTGNPAAMSAFRPGEWNRFEIECIGPRIRTRVNGVACSEWFDGAVSGLLAFQVHGGKACEVAFRDAHLEELGAHAWRSDPSDTGAYANAMGWSRALSAQARGIRLEEVRGVATVEVSAADGSTLATVALPADGKTPDVSGERGAGVSARAIEILWLQGAGAVLVDGARVASLVLAAPPARLTLSGAEISLGRQLLLTPVVHNHSGGDAVDER